MVSQILPPMSIPSSVLQLDLELDKESKSYVTNYPLLVNALKDKKMDAKGFALAAHMVYGWMPTVLTLIPSMPKCDFSVEVEVLERAREGGQLSPIDFRILAEAVNKSIIGASKLLHFVNPDRYAIWDTKVYAFLIHGKVAEPVVRPAHSTVNSIERFIQYQTDLALFTKRDEFFAVHQRVNEQLKYKVSPMRAAELLMFTNAPKFISNKKKN